MPSLPYFSNSFIFTFSGVSHHHMGAAVKLPFLVYLSYVDKRLISLPCYMIKMSTVYHKYLESFYECYAISAYPDQTTHTRSLIWICTGCVTDLHWSQMHKDVFPFATFTYINDYNKMNLLMGTVINGLK